MRSDDPDDQRSKRVQLTPRGEALRRAIRRTVAKIEAELEAELGQASYARLRTLLLRLNDTRTIAAERDLA